MSPSTRTFMDDFWQQGFLPRPLASPTQLRYRWPAVFLIVAVLGLAALWRARRDVALLLAGPRRSTCTI